MKKLKQKGYGVIAIITSTVVILAILGGFWIAYNKFISPREIIKKEMEEKIEKLEKENEELRKKIEENKDSLNKLFGNGEK